MYILHCYTATGKSQGTHLTTSYCIVHRDILAAITEQLQTLSKDKELAMHEAELHSQFATVFEPPPHANDLPRQPLAHITLKDANKMIQTWNYLCPQKWKEAWHMLLQQHLDVGRIHPSSTPTGSGTFIIPKCHSPDSSFLIFPLSLTVT